MKCAHAVGIAESTPTLTLSRAVGHVSCGKRFWPKRPRRECRCRNVSFLTLSRDSRWIMVADYRKNSETLGESVSSGIISLVQALTPRVVDPRYSHRSRSLCLRRRSSASRSTRVPDISRGFDRCRRTRQGFDPANGQGQGRSRCQRQRKLYRRRSFPSRNDAATCRGKCTATVPCSLLTHWSSAAARKDQAPHRCRRGRTVLWSRQSGLLW